MKFSLVNSSFDRSYALVTEASFFKLDNVPMTSLDKNEIYRKVCLIREYLEQCKVLWNEIEDFGVC